MTRNALTVSSDATVLSIAETMAERRISCVVVADSPLPEGIISERDMVRCLASTLRNPEHQPQFAKEIMTAPPIVLKQNSTVTEALVLMQTRRIRRLAVVDDAGKLVGLVTQSDLAKHQIELLEQQQRLQEQNAKLAKESLEDRLTKIGNRRKMELDLAAQHQHALDNDEAYSIALIDVDHFKKYNDHYGHPKGDRALQQVAQAIKKTIRASDRAYRYGGEEFLVLLAGTPLQGATIFANRLLQNIGELHVEHTPSPFGQLTASIGLSELNERDKWEQVVESADQGLYSAKEGGRNRLFAMEG